MVATMWASTGSRNTVQKDLRPTSGRYNSPADEASIYPMPDGKVRVEFDTPQPAITPGQVLGIYDDTDTYILGGGWID